MPSRNLTEAREILERQKGAAPSEEERLHRAIDLAALMLAESNRSMSWQEKATQKQLARLFSDPKGKAFTTSMTDECFRSTSHTRAADQILYLLSVFGTPSYLTGWKKFQLSFFKLLSPSIAGMLIPFVTRSLRKETEQVILPGEAEPLAHHMKIRQGQGVRLNLNHLGEAILSEKEAEKRLSLYLSDLENPMIDYVSVKISTLFSQIHLLAFDETVEAIAHPLRKLYRAAQRNPVLSPDGTKRPKFVNLDMEEYRDLSLTVAVFRKVLEEKEFESYSAGIVLQAYLPDSHPIQKELTEWAKKRVQEGGAPIKIRIVKGANLAMEQFEASLRGWPQAPYQTKAEVDANYKQMVAYACAPEHARFARVGVASHNLFDIAYAMLLREENVVHPYVGFEMLEGMAESMRRTVQSLAGDMLLYCPVATKEEFQHAIAYLVRRLDENTGPENFLRHAFDLKPGSESWDQQTKLFLESGREKERVFKGARRTQNRLVHSEPTGESDTRFENEPDTDFSLPQNQKWIRELASHWEKHAPAPIPLVIAGKTVAANEDGVGTSPSAGGAPLYKYAKGEISHLEQVLSSAIAAHAEWKNTSLEHRFSLLGAAAQKLRERRGELIGAMMLDTGKAAQEADVEVSEAIDFAEYYRHQMKKWGAVLDISFSSKGVVLVTPPWNFPCAIPAGGILAALATGNCVVFKPASEAVLVAWHLANALWDAGIPKEVLQFFPCPGEPIGAALLQDPRVSLAILTGGTATALRFLQLRPDLDLAAETGGKNSLIVTALGDRDLAIKDILQSAFGHGGQKCSAASLLILEKEVYDDPHFLQLLKEAAASLKVASPWDLSTRVNPLIHPPKGVLQQALTTLEPGEEWLLEPRVCPDNPCLWSPGIKLHVKPLSFTHVTEFFGPVLGVMRADDLSHAISLANAVPYGLTSGLHSLDVREQKEWAQEIIAGNLYINRTTTGAIVQRQPFGGTKASSFGRGSKAGGPNYLLEFLHAKQKKLPQEKHPVNSQVNRLTELLACLDLSAEELGLWTASIANYAYWWKRMRQQRDPTKIVGQDNFFRYIPRKKIALRLQQETLSLDGLRIIAAALTCGAELEVSFAKSELPWKESAPTLRVIEESDAAFEERLKNGLLERVRLAEPAPFSLKKAAAIHGLSVLDAPVLANGRLELLHYVREVSLSIDYHRYGNLGLREGELRRPIL